MFKNIQALIDAGIDPEEASEEVAKELKSRLTQSCIAMALGLTLLVMGVVTMLLDIGVAQSLLGLVAIPIGATHMTFGIRRLVALSVIKNRAMMLMSDEAFTELLVSEFLKPDKADN